MKTPQRRALGALFFIYAFGLMSWVPRFPEVKAHLGVSNGEFGTLISFTAIGSIISLLTVGQLVNRYGSRNIMTISATFLFGSIFLIVHLNTPWQFLLCNIALGLGTSGLHTSINGQALHEQKPSGENLISRLHGLWSLGALTTSILAGLLAGKVSLVVHIDLLCAVVYISILLLLRFLEPTLLPPNKSAAAAFKFKNIFQSFNLDWRMAIGLTCAVALEFAVGDWAAIFSKEELYMSPSVSAIPYVLFMLAMIIGRLTIHKLTNRFTLSFLIQRFVVSGGAIFMASLILGVQISKSSLNLGFAIVAIGAFVGGLGASFLAPMIMDAANRRSNSSGAVVVGQLGAINVFQIFIIKFIIAWTAQITSVGVALLIPGAMLIGLAFLAKTIERAHH